MGVYNYGPNMQPQQNDPAYNMQMMGVGGGMPTV